MGEVIVVVQLSMGLFPMYGVVILSGKMERQQDTGGVMRRV